MGRKRALGRGLKALIPDTPRARAGLTEIPVDRLRSNPAQPRCRFDLEALEGLASSIREHGMLQPILVTEDGEDRYVVIAGERRWRAARLAGLSSVPAVIREHVQAASQLELALVENLQRRDLTPLEEARAFESLRVNLGLSQEEIGARVGISRSAIANSLRLLHLAPHVQEAVEEGRLSAGQARALLAFADEEQRLRWFERTLTAGLSVRELERAAAEARSASAAGPRRPRTVRTLDPNLRDAEDKLALVLGTRVEIRARRRGGNIVIRCSSDDELMRVYELLTGGK